MKRWALLLIVACAACDDVDEPPRGTTAWHFGPTMPRRAVAAGETIFGQRVVVAGGFATGEAEGLTVSAEVNVYDLLDKKWRLLPELPVRWSYINLAAIADTLYVLGGLEGTPGAYVAHGEAYRLDPLKNRWIGIQPIDPGDARGAAGVIASPGHIFLLGGATGTGSVTSCLRYEIALDRWTRLPDLPEPLAQPAVMQTSDGRLIVAGGLTGGVDDPGASPVSSNVYSLLLPDADDGASWIARTPILSPDDPAPRAGCAFGAVLGTLVCAGGEGEAQAHTATASYDPFLDVWTAREAMPLARTGATGAATSGQLFIPGGSDSAALEPTDSLLIYRPLDTAP